MPTTCTSVKKRRELLILGIVFLTGCAVRLDSRDIYEEQIDSLAITPSGDKLAVLGASYHYVFSSPSKLTDALRSGLRRHLTADFETFELASPSEISGKWRLLYSPKPGDDTGLVALAKSLQFTLDPTGQYALEGNIEGERYSKKNYSRPATVERTNKVYSIRVKRSQQFSDREQIANTPLSSDARGTLLGLIVLLPLILLINGNRGLF